MTILLYKDGRLVIDDGNPIEGNSLEGLVACVSDPQSGDTLKFDGNQWVAGAAASGLPAVSGDDNGKVLTVVEGEWAPAAGGGGGGSLIVEITQSGNVYTMNKTAGEIIEALSSGKQIICSLPDENLYSNQYTQVLATSAEKDYSTQEISAVSIYLLHSTSIEQYTAQGLTDYPSVSYD